jgi:hypothetical protein
MLRKNLRKLVTVTILIIATLLLFMPTRQVNAVAAVRYYKVYNYCFGPTPPQSAALAGEWTRECDGTWVGWGERPGEYSCSEYTLEYGDLCEF